MTPDYWDEVESIFAEALDVTDVERPALIEVRCQDRADLRSEVESLLAAHGSASSFIDPITLDPSGSGSTPAARIEDIDVGSRVGVFCLTARLGEGGMGTVFLANRTDGQFEQQVAIKFTGSWLHDATSVSRFRVERQILASLHHPNIVGLLDGGVTAQGQAYLVMEYVDGVPITEYCAAKCLSLGDRLDLFRQVCAAAQFAHRHLVVHCDLKPANILVTADGVPKVLDFGVAMLVGPGASADHTNADAGHRPLTANYASPEQLRGSVPSTACDVYALGVLGYELLTGARPYDTRGLNAEQSLAVVLNGPLHQPSAMPQGPQTQLYDARLLRGDLDAIVGKAMSPDSGRRYSSAEEIADDVARFSRGEPIMAREPSFPYLARKLAQRHRVAVGIAAISIALLLGATVVALGQRQVALRERTRAEARFNEVRRLANSLIFKIHDAVAPLPGSTPVRKTIVIEALGYLDQLAAEARDDTTLQIEVARAYARIGDIQGNPTIANLGDRDGALASFKRAIALLEPISGQAAAPPEAASEMTEVLMQLAITQYAGGQKDDAISNARTALANARGLNAAHQSPDMTALLGRSEVTLAITLRSAESVSLLQEAIGLFSQRLKEVPDDSATLRNVALAEKYLGAQYDILDRKEASASHKGESASHYEAALALDSKIVAIEPANRRAQLDLAIDLANVADRRLQESRLDDAARLFEDSLRIRREVSDADPRDTFARAKLVYPHRMLSSVYSRMGRSYARQALQHGHEAVAIAEQMVAVAPDTIHRYELAEAFFALGQTQLTAGLSNEGCATLALSQELIRRPDVADHLARADLTLTAEVARAVSSCVAVSKTTR